MMKEDWRDETTKLVSFFSYWVYIAGVAYELSFPFLNTFYIFLEYSRSQAHIHVSINKLNSLLIPASSCMHADVYLPDSWIWLATEME